MLLTAFVFNNKPCLNGHGGGAVNIPLKIEDTPSFGYIDVSSISNWYNEGFNLDRDFIFVRDRISEKVIELAQANTIATINSLDEVNNSSQGDRYLAGKDVDSALGYYPGGIFVYLYGKWEFRDPEIQGYYDVPKEEKEYLAKLYIGEQYQHEADFGVDTVKQWRGDYHNNATDARSQRLKKAEGFIEIELRAYSGLIVLTITSLVTELDVGFGSQLYSIDMHKNFKEFGIKGSIEDYHPVKNPQPSVGIMDYIMSRNLFDGKGLRSMPWQPATLPDIKAACERLHQILVIG